MSPTICIKEPKKFERLVITFINKIHKIIFKNKRWGSKKIYHIYIEFDLDFENGIQ